MANPERGEGLSEDLRELREALDACPRDAGGRRNYGEELMTRAGRYAQTRRACGGGVTEIARELGVWESQVTRWLKRLKGKGFREVSVVASAEPVGTGVAKERPQTAPAQALVVRSPRGFVIEGLTVLELRELWGGL